MPWKRIPRDSEVPLLAVQLNMRVLVPLIEAFPPPNNMDTLSAWADFRIPWKRR